MRGCSIKRGDTWTALWDRPPDPETGRRRQGSKGGFPTKKAADAHLATVVTATARGHYVEPSKQPLGRYLLDDWLPVAKGTLKPLSVFRYEKVIRTYVLPHDIGAVPLAALDGGHFDRLYADMEDQGLSVATRRLTHAVVRRALNDAVRRDRLARNPVEKATPPSLPESTKDAWSMRELRTFLGHVEGDRLEALWVLAATTGMRRGELLGLPWQYLDLDGASLRVEQQLLPTKGGATFGSPKSKKSRRTVDLDGPTVAALRRHRDVQLLERDLAGDAYEDHDLVFANEIGKPIDPQRATDWFRRHRKAAGLSVGSLHTLRHTHITELILEGVPVSVVADRVGDDPKTLLSTYTHVKSRSRKQAASTFAKALWPSADKPLTNPVAPALQTAL